MLGENCPVVTPATEDSNMSLAEQSDSAAPVQPEFSIKTQYSTESRQTSSPIQERGEEGDSSMEEGAGSDSASGSNSKQSDEGEPASESGVGPSTPLEGSPDLPSRKNLSAVRGARDNQGQESQRRRAVSPLKENQTQTVRPKKQSLKQLMILYKKAAEMLRGMKKLPKRLNAPKRWRLDKRNRKFRTRTSPSPQN